MRNTVAKRLRKESQNETVGKPAVLTEILYRQKKQAYKSVKQNRPISSNFSVINRRNTVIKKLSSLKTIPNGKI